MEALSSLSDSDWAASSVRAAPVHWIGGQQKRQWAHVPESQTGPTTPPTIVQLAPTPLKDVKMLGG